MKELSKLDYGVVVVYLLAIAALGSSFYRPKTTAKDYFLGGRLMSWVPAGISIVAADLSAITVMGIPAWTYAHNLQLLWLSAGYLLTAPVVIYVFVPFYAQLNLYTAYEYLERRFNLAVRLVTSTLFQSLRAVHVAIALYAPALIVNLATGVPVWKCILYMGGFATIYTTVGGMKAVIWTDVIQFVTITSGVLCICIAAVIHVPGGLPVIYRIAREGGRLNVLNLSVSPRDLTSIWACVIGGSILVLTTLTTDQAILQRLFTTKSVQDCKRSIVLQAIVNVPVVVMLNFVGVVLFAFYFFHRGDLTELSRTDAILPFFVVTQLPSGISGLIIVAILSASMGVMSAGINALSTATTVDFYQRVVRPNETSGHYAQVGRIGTVCWGAGCTALALFAGRLGALALAFARVSSFVCGPLLGIFLLASVTKRTTSMGALVGGFIGASAVVVLTVCSKWSFLYEGAIGVSITLVSGYVASLFEAPPPPEQVQPYVL